MAHLEDQPMQLDLQSAVQLLTRERRELFQFEKAIALLEYLPGHRSLLQFRHAPYEKRRRAMPTPGFQQPAK
jgi:hypothetical protein